MIRAAAIAAALVLTVVLAIAGWPASLFLERDFVHFWLGAKAVLAGRDLYDATLWRTVQNQLGSSGPILDGAGFRYPPMTALTVIPFALLPFPLAAAAWYVGQGAAAVVALAAIARRTFHARPRWDLAVLLCFAAVIRPDFIIPTDGNITGFLVGIVGGAVALLLAGHPLAAGVLLAFGVVKPHLLIVFVPALFAFVGLRDRVRLFIGTFTTTAALVLLSFALQPRWLVEWSEQTLRAGNYAGTNLWGVIPREAAWLAWAIAIGLVALLFAWWRITEPSLPVASGAALAASVLLAPYAFMIDQAVLLVGVAAYVSLVQELAPAPRNLLLLLLVAAASPWYMGVLIDVVPVNLVRLLPVFTVLAMLVVTHTLLAARASRRIFAVAGSS